MILIPNSYGVLVREFNDCHSPKDGKFCSGGTSKLADAERLLNDAKADGNVVLYHSGDASIDAAIVANGVQPMFGDWLEEVLAGATDSEEAMEEIRNQEPTTFFSEDPGWVSMKVARKLDKSVHDVTAEDVKRHGQLSMVVVDPTDNDFLRGDENGERATRFGGTEIEEYEVPFGVESNDIYTRGAVTPDMTLTGVDLLRFLARNYPSANVVKGGLGEYMDQRRLGF